MWRNARVSCTTSMRIMSQRLPMISRSRFLLVGCAAAALLSSAGCRYLHQDMADQPKNRPLSPSDFFPDGRSERPPVEKDRKSTRLNSSHGYISYAVFCLKKKISEAQPRQQCRVDHGVRPLLFSAPLRHVALENHALRSVHATRYLATERMRRPTSKPILP